MDKNINIFSNLMTFLIVAIIFLVALFVIFMITLKNYNVKSSKLKFYGLFLEMDNRGILAFSAISLNFIFLVWCTTTFTGLNYIYVLMTLTFMVFANLVNRNYKKLPRDLLFTLIK